MTAAKRVVILRSNAVAPDTRVEKTAASLTKAGYQVKVVAWDRSGGEAQPYPNTAIEIHRIGQRGRFGSGIGNILGFLIWSFKLLFWLIKNSADYDIIHACDFDTVIPAMVVKKWFDKRLVYDIFDFMAEASRHIPWPVRFLVRNLDLQLIGMADLVVLADDSRREQIRASRPRRLTVTYNSPEASLAFTPRSPLTPAFNIGFVGILQTDRGIPEMIEAVAGSSRFHLHLAGFGGDEQIIRSMCQDKSNITLYGKIDYKKAMELYSGCQLMFAIYDPANPNHKYSSPNKFFEALLLGVPIIVAQGTGIDTLVVKHGTGVVVPYRDPGALKVAIEAMALESDQVRKMRQIRLQKLFHEEFAWERQAERLIKEYASLA